MEQDYRSIVKDMLEGLLNDILRVEHKAIEPTAGFIPLSMSELHIIEVVGKNDGNIIMSEIARKLRITLPTLTAAVDRLENKEYIVRQRSSADRRQVIVGLTEEGRKAYARHAQFHDRMVEAFVEGLEKARMPELLEALKRLREFFREQAGLGEAGPEDGR